MAVLDRRVERGQRVGVPGEHVVGERGLDEHRRQDVGGGSCVRQRLGLRGPTAGPDAGAEQQRHGREVGDDELAEHPPGRRRRPPRLSAALRAAVDQADPAAAARPPGARGSAPHSAAHSSPSTPASSTTAGGIRRGYGRVRAENGPATRGATDVTRQGQCRSSGRRRCRYGDVRNRNRREPRRRRRGAPLWLYLTALVLVPMLGVVGLTTSLALSRLAEATSAERAEDGVRTLARLDEARSSVEREIIPFLTLTLIDDPATSDPLGLPASVLLEQRNDAVTAGHEARTRTDEALERIPTGSPGADAAVRAAAVLADLRSRIDAQEIDVQQVYLGYLDVSTDLMNAQQRAASTASAEQVAADALQATADVQLVAELAQAASRQTPLFLGAHLDDGQPLQGSRLAWDTAWLAYTDAQGRMDDLSQQSLREEWWRVRASSVVSRLDQTLGGYADSTADETVSVGQLLSLLVADAAAGPVAGRARGHRRRRRGGTGRRGPRPRERPARHDRPRRPRTDRPRPVRGGPAGPQRLPFAPAAGRPGPPDQRGRAGRGRGARPPGGADGVLGPRRGGRRASPHPGPGAGRGPGGSRQRGARSVAARPARRGGARVGPRDRALGAPARGTAVRPRPPGHARPAHRAAQPGPRPRPGHGRPAPGAAVAGR